MGNPNNRNDELMVPALNEEGKVPVMLSAREVLELIQVLDQYRKVLGFLLKQEKQSKNVTQSIVDHYETAIGQAELLCNKIIAIAQIGNPSEENIN